MDKRQLRNTLGLYKIRSKEHKKSFLILCGILLLLFMVDMVNTLTEVFSYSKDATTYNMQTYTQAAFYISIILCVGILFWYKTYNHQHEVFPQNNKTRFLSYVMFNYTSLLKLSLFSIFLYLAQYGLFSIIRTFNPNIHFVYPINFSFLISGFVVNFLYGSIIIALTILFGTLDRKFNLYFRISAIGLIIVGFLNDRAGFKYIIDLSKFWTKEPSFFLFMIKALGILIVILVLSWVINSHTVYYKSSAKVSSKFNVIAISIIVLNCFTLLFTTNSNVTEEGTTVSPYYKEANDFETSHEIEIDLSTIQPDVPLVVIKNFDSDEENFSLSHNSDEAIGKVYENLIIEYKLPANEKDFVNLNNYKNPVLTTRLDGNKLYINYSYDENQKVLFLSSYGFMSQFDSFKGKGLHKEYTGSMVGTRGGYIDVIYPKGLKVKTETN